MERLNESQEMALNEIVKSWFDDTYSVSIDYKVELVIIKDDYNNYVQIVNVKMDTVFEVYKDVVNHLGR